MEIVLTYVQPPLLSVANLLWLAQMKLRLHTGQERCLSEKVIAYTEKAVGFIIGWSSLSTLNNLVRKNSRSPTLRGRRAVRLTSKETSERNCLALTAVLSIWLRMLSAFYCLTTFGLDWELAKLTLDLLNLGQTLLLLEFLDAEPSEFYLRVSRMVSAWCVMEQRLWLVIQEHFTRRETVRWACICGVALPILAWL
uniref:Uncharacterized protein n=1 Tax=Riboviria sp. TaxID=2585031 RepID=A0A8K1WQI8_9VIRU|nr:MAG: hypothetical protein 3 [Riboviria sp.]